TRAGNFPLTAASRISRARPPPAAVAVDRDEALQPVHRAGSVGISRACIARSVWAASDGIPNPVRSPAPAMRNSLTLFVPVTRQRTRILASAGFNTKSCAHGFDLES